MKRMIPVFIINLLLLVTLNSCHNNPLDVDISKIDLDLEIKRLDIEIFTIDFDSIDKSIDGLYQRYGGFFDAFNVYIINIGSASDRYYSSYLSMFVNDPQNLEVFNYTQKVFSDLSETDKILEEAFKRYLYHYPDSVVPEIVGFVSRFNHKLVTYENYIGIGLDQYLGRNCRYYDMLQTPEYLQYNLYPEKIPSDVVYQWGSAKYPYNDSRDNSLNRMIYEGLLLYFTDALLPDMPDSIKIGFSPDQMKFCRNNEKQMWTYLIENKLLFSTDPLVIRKLTEDAPSTYYFPSESPGKAAVWIGWQIVREWVRKNPGLSVPKIMAESDYQKILYESKYNP